MRRARINPRSSSMGRAVRRRCFGLTLSFLLFAGIARMIPAAGQTPAPEAPAPAGGPEAPVATGGGQQQPLVPGGAADILPPPPGGGFGFPNPLTPPNAINNAVPPAAPALPTTPLGLPAPGFGVVTLQQNDPNAPAYLIRPRISVSETFTDNVNYVHSPRDGDAYTNILPGLSFSADTPRFQGLATGNLNAYIYARESTFDQVVGNLYASGFGTIWPDALFVDLRSAITQSATSPTFGFQNLSQLPPNQQTQVYTGDISPYLRKSFDGLVDTELRYRLDATQYGGATTVTAPTPASTALGSGVLNEGTLTVATGRDFERALSRVTVDALNFNSTFLNRNTQVSAYDDLEYRITPQIGALGRAGYQNIEFPGSPAATFAGATWLAGGRIGSYGPEQAYLTLEYGRQQGVYGFTGAARYSITPTMLFTATLVQGLSTSTQYIQSSLANSTLDSYGSIVDEYSGLPTAFYSPGLGLTNNVYKQHLFNAGISETIGLNHLSLYANYANQQSLTPPTTAPTKSYGINFAWSRNIRPDLSGNASVGYYNSTNVVTSAVATPISSQNSVFATIGVNYLLSPTLTGSILYTFSYQNNGSGVGGGTGDVVVNQLVLQLSKTF
jgi:hypothetical protein